MTVLADSPKARVLIFFLLSVLSCSPALSQMDTATISGYITDQSGAVVSGAAIILTNVETGIHTAQSSNGSGLYVFTYVKPGDYRIVVEKARFRQIALTDMTVNVQDLLSRNFRMEVGAVGESITVSGNKAYVNTVSGTVSTVVDQHFVDNMPLNGRSFQSLLALAPGVVFTSLQEGFGQFSVNGQRSDANYWMVDGVSANFGITPDFFTSQTLAGTTPALTSGGGTNGLVSVDAMQEFRIQTSTYAPEFGRTPGGQVSIVTKSGTNQFHGVAFDYLRNDVFDARNWFDQPPLLKPPLRQNDFGGTVGGPLRKDQLFFFFSYEGLRLLLPQTASGLFYTQSARDAASPAYKPYMNALPLPTAPPVDPSCDNVTQPCLAPLATAYSDPSSINATSLRMDYTVNKRISLFGRYDHAPSSETTRAWEEEHASKTNVDTVTAGTTIMMAPSKVNEFRANWSRVTSGELSSLTDYLGAVVPSTALLFPPPYGPGTSNALVFFPDGDLSMAVPAGSLNVNTQRQLNFVDTFSWAIGTHQLKLGIDYRRLSPGSTEEMGWAVFPQAYTSIVAGVADSDLLDARAPLSFHINNYSLYAQDTWKAGPRLTLTYGLRWEVNTPPSGASRTPLYVTEGIFDSRPLAVVPGRLWSTTAYNLAPRIGVAYQVTSKVVLRGGYGLFYDLGYGDVGNSYSEFPYYRTSFIDDPTLPFNLSNPAFLPPPFSTTINANTLDITAVDPHLQLPFTMEWNGSFEQALGSKQTLKLTYVGADGRRLLREDGIVPKQFFDFGSGGVIAIHNLGYSHYNALQVQFQRQLSSGLQALVSYNLSKASDQGSSDIEGVSAPSINQVVPPPLTPADIDIRNSFAGAVSYQISAPSWGTLSTAILKDWAVDGLLRVSSTPPINVTIGVISPQIGRYLTQAEIVGGQSYWLPAPGQPGGRVLNPDAFTRPAAGMTGNFPRNGLRSPFSINQTDLALRRRFNLTERVTLDVRAEYFNVFNHPMFGSPASGDAPNTFWGYGATAVQGFGQVTPGNTTNVDAGLQNPLYAVGGPRSGQLTLKITF